MGESANYLEILFFAAIAAVLVFRLRSVLGKRTGHEGPPARFGKGPADDAKPAREGLGNVVTLPDRLRKGIEDAETTGPADGDEDVTHARGQAAILGLAAIRKADPDFDPAGFVEGARSAFEMIVEAFAAGDTEALEQLLNQEMLRSFTEAIEERRGQNHTLTTTIVSFKSAEIVDASLQHRTAYVTVEFVTEQLKLLKDSEGRIIEGDPANPETITDLWTFARSTKATDPNWTLVKTDAAE